MRYLPSSLVPWVVLLPTALCNSCDADLTVQTRGGVVHGIANNSTPAVRQFLGIPYARPPLGDLRFAPPQPALPFGESNASEVGPSCMQYLSDLPTASLPVLVFFYGGAFVAGGVDTPYLYPTQWIQRTQSHIVVAFNHRDNILGFPNAAGLPPDQQNVGLLDQRLVLEWVRANIAAFGGDPARIGAWGQSSGSVAIAYYSYVYQDDPIINSVILDSGNEFIDILTYDQTHANFTFMASQFGCGNLSPADELACMRRVDAGAMQDFMHKYYTAGSSPLITFSPVVDNHTVFSNYTARAEAGKTARLPALIGSNAQDGNMFVAYDPNGVDEGLADQMTSFYFFCPTYQAAKVRIAAGTGPVYRYLYAGNFSNVSPRGWMGAWHGSELPLVFGTHGDYRGESTELERLTSWAMQDAWVEFVATAGERMSIVSWNDSKTVDGGPLVEFGNGVPVRVVEAKEMEQRCGV
ncbi:Alpha/Beta hydrolase protein [Coniochaeta sp. 2T2.1]|nr:Alpha/Beta hydrolase protein [Coniochaeta sp. 2T2.1]